MAVIQTPHGRIVGLILQQDQPKEPPKAEEPKPVEEPVKAAPAKRPGRPPKK